MPPFSVYLNNAARFLLPFFLRKIPGAVYVCPSVVLIQEGTKSSWVSLDHWGKAAEQKNAYSLKFFGIAHRTRLNLEKCMGGF